ncbi:MAG: hypothetical protein WC943_04225 [Elusimicrobiota bacterium]|jgi:hypothetical protein
MKRWVWLMMLALALAGCGKKKAPPAAPGLSVPEKPSASGTVPGTSAQLSAAAEVTASSGPAQLTLRVYKTKIAPEDRDADTWKKGAFLSLWVQAELKNVGTKRLAITPERFYEPGPITDRKEGDLMDPLGIFLEVTDAAGNRMPGPHPVMSLHAPDCRPDPVELKPGDLEYAETSAFVEKLRKKGLDWREINLKLRAFVPKEKRREPESHVVLLEPGASTRTAGWVGFDPCAVYVYHMPRPKPIGEFARALYYFPKPGKYFVRAVYDTMLFDSVKEYTRRSGHPPREDEFVFRTPAIEFEALP